MEGLYVSTDARQVQPFFVHKMLLHTYWGHDLTLERVVEQVRNAYGIVSVFDAVCFRQIGYARVDLIGESARLRDVVVHTGYRGSGIGKRITSEALSIPLPSRIKQWELHTDDAHDFYALFGFRKRGEKLMVMPAVPGQKSELREAPRASRVA